MSRTAPTLRAHCGRTYAILLRGITTCATCGAVLWVGLPRR